MSSAQQSKPELVESLAQGGTGPEYDFPTSNDDGPAQVVKPSTADAELSETDRAKAPGENAAPLSDDEIATEEKLEADEAGEWSEDLASNEPLPGEVEELLPEEKETLPSDRG